MPLSNFQRANTLKSAFKVCTLEPLEGEDIEKYYVDLSAVRKTSAVESVSTILDFQEPADFSTILFTGHRGSGKSTELKRIQKIWEQNYHVIYLEVNEETDINDASYTDLYLIVIKQVEFELRKLGLSFDTQLLKSFESWFKDITQETEETVEKSVSIEGEATLQPEAPFIAKLMVKLLAQIKGSHKQKTTIRQTLEKDLSRLKADINLLLGDAYVKLRNKFPDYKGLLIIFDNLDRVTPTVANHLFFDYASQLQELHCTIIYTVPISVLCSPKHPLNLFDGNPHIVPMVNIYEFKRDICDLNYQQAGLDAVASLIEKRVDIDAVFNSREELLNLAKASGGHVRQLMQMMRTACQTASTRKHPKITAEDIIYAVKQQQFSFERFIPEEHYPLLAQICISKDVSKDEIGQLMLFNTSVLEYNGDNRWNYPNPVVKQNEFFQRAITAALSTTP
ncbi:P-loop NTPase fold protein [Cylindrospermum sp. FACHB-282]|uniref:P-loop NTPase fold protein n=1 Tax=Cylindrospermum sp. FACHB-282 TaxID=2692794 RepID=UPI001687700C|nr:P-loop NTPase fold protein [Cylindrospermum sp. FACHB-282]MBD2385875.1 AAA family ATPase [Cylindrospermum sp. FACHB-282]